MRDNRSDKNIERNLEQKCRFVQGFYAFHGTTRQTFVKYYNCFC